MEYYRSFNVQGENQYSTEIPKTRSEMVPHLPPSSSIGSNRGDDSPTFVLKRP